MRTTCLLLLAISTFASAAEPTTASMTIAVANDASLKAAIGAARGKPGTRIVLADGTYFLNAPLVLTPEHSGVTIEAAPGAKPVISGGRKITGWRKASFGKKDVFAADISGV